MMMTLEESDARARPLVSLNEGRPFALRRSRLDAIFARSGDLEPAHARGFHRFEDDRAIGVVYGGDGLGDVTR